VAAIAINSGSVSVQEFNPVSSNLTPKLRELLREGMLPIEDASHRSMSYLMAKGDVRVAEVAQQIHDSFVLRQLMTPEDKPDLMAAVPEDFVNRDRAFRFSDCQVGGPRFARRSVQQGPAPSSRAAPSPCGEP
jgi:hypothetical protein